MRTATGILALLKATIDGPVVISEWARAADVPRRTAYRWLAELRAQGLVVSTPRGWVAQLRYAPPPCACDCECGSRAEVGPLCPDCHEYREEHGLVG